MDLCDSNYSSHYIEGILQVLLKSTVTSNSKKMFQRIFNKILLSNSSSSEGEEVVNLNMTLPEKLQNINKERMCILSHPWWHAWICLSSHLYSLSRTSFFYTWKCFQIKIHFFDILTKPKACITDSLAILSYTQL